jgi:hypothetical protein
MKKEISTDTILENIGRLEKGDKIVIELVDKEDIKKYELYQYKIESLNNLFKMYIEENTDVANEANVKDFLEYYTTAHMNWRKTRNRIFLSTFGEDLYREILKIKVRINIDWQKNSLVIIKV